MQVAKKLAMKYDMALLAVESRKRSGQFKLLEADQPSKRLVRHKGNREVMEVTHLYYLNVSAELSFLWISVIIFDSFSIAFSFQSFSVQEHCFFKVLF